jgi:hypothetical protein
VLEHTAELIDRLASRIERALHGALAGEPHSATAGRGRRLAWGCAAEASG